MRKKLTAVGVAAVLSFMCGAASANGRFPEANAMFFAPNDPDLVVLRVTFGMMLSRDRGKTWDWVCERSIGLAGVEDPMYAITPDGTFIGSTFQGLAVSHDSACSFTRAGGELNDLVFIDVAARPSDRGNVLAFASSYDGQNDAGEILFKSTLFETKDQGKTFAAIGPSFDPTLLGETVDLTATDPNRIYVSAVRNPGTSASAVLLTSRDYGKTWEENAVPLIAGERAAFIAAVDPNKADRVYVRTSNASDQPSRLLVTDDAGKTLRAVFTSKSALSGFALSTDGAKVWVGSMKDGVLMASTSDFSFQQTSTIEAQCLALTPDGLWACSNEKSGFVAALSTDEGKTFAPKLRFCDVRGPMACPAGTTTNLECTLGGATASPPWPVQLGILGCTTGDGGTGGADGGGGPTTTGSASSSDDDGGCSIRGPSRAPVAALGLLSSVCALALVRRRRKYRRK